MRSLVIFAHPQPESFSASLHRLVLDRLASRGWEIDDLDLNAVGFDPVMSEKERQLYHDETVNSEPVSDYVTRLRAAEALILVFPVWTYGFPAILKGFFDRVCLPGVAFRIEDGKLKPNLLNIRKLAAVTTYGGTRLRAIGAGDPPRRIVKRAVHFYCQPEKTRYIALYDMNRADHQQRCRFMDRVGQEMDQF